MREHEPSELDAVDRAIIRVIGEHQSAGAADMMNEPQIWTAIAEAGFAEGVGPADVSSRVARLIELGYVARLPPPLGRETDPPGAAYELTRRGVEI